MDEPEVLALFERCSNVGRWGPEDGRGTLNFITPEKRVEAARLVRSGRSVSLAMPLRSIASRANPRPIVHRMIEGDDEGAAGSSDAVEIAPHGYAVTHLDALGHAYFEGRAWNGRRVSEVWSPNGLRTASIDQLGGGVFTRGVLLDVARAQGRRWLEAGDPVTAEHLDAAEVLAGTTVGRGDAVIVRVGLAAREAVQGEEDPSIRAGLTPDCLPWLFDREVAVYGGDCIEQLPSPYPRVPSPFHQVALVSMGLVLLDCPAVEDLGAAVDAEGRAEFLLTCAPLPIPGGTGSPVNPLAVF
jgi:kynurenine formamidase